MLSVGASLIIIQGLPSGVGYFTMQRLVKKTFLATMVDFSGFFLLLISE